MSKLIRQPFFLLTVIAMVMLSGCLSSKNAKQTATGEQRPLPFDKGKRTRTAATFDDAPLGVEATVDNPAIATFTQSANNTIQALSPYDFYVFTECIVLDGVDFSTRISMMALVDLICYELLARRKAAETAI